MKWKNKRIVIIALLVLGLISIPLIAMQFTNEVQWKATDFAVMGVLLLGVGIMIDWVIRKVGSLNSRILLIAALLLALMLIWAELAVGIFETPFAGSWKYFA
jgi:hypothetical protein